MEELCSEVSTESGRPEERSCCYINRWVQSVWHVGGNIQLLACVCHTPEPPPGESMRSHNMLLSMIIPGPKYPGKNMNVYLEPLVEDLAVGWNGRGVRTYDASTNDHFDMYVWYHTSLHDLPARALFCGWCTHGKWPCPQCRHAMTFF